MPDISALPDFTPAHFRVAPLAESETIPSSWYTCAGYHALEQEQILARTWQGIGHVSRLENAGDCIVAVVADNPVLVVRGNDRMLRAFFNVCRHRGGPLATEDGHCRMLQCHYHGWTYRLDGSLRGVPRWDRVDLFDKKDYGLVRITRNGASLLAGKSFFKRVVYDVRCNWKVYVDNYLEGYHLPHVHPELCSLLDVQKYVTETGEHHSLQYSPFQSGDSIYGSGGNEAYYFFIWPNVMLNIIPGRLQTNRVVPVCHDHCQVIFDYFYDDVTSPEARQRADADLEYSHKIQLEDIGICEHVQRGLGSRAYDRGRFSVECEEGVYHFQSLLKRAYERIYAASRA
ncbi:MAG: aromatic ring-hydroxylating dioxygenase subunit alpha [candidate division Zixibacteria bacterium]|nr:aromatic ring-hydroxylating dioxygenase subunit alpha [candidate division Zixibacteria bacterium]